MPKNPVQNADASRRLFEEFQLQGKQNLEMDQTVVPVAQLADLSDPGLTPYGIGRQQAAVAGEFGVAQIVNPIGSGVVMVIRRIIVASDGAPGRFCRLHLGTAAAQQAGGTSTGVRLDARKPFSQHAAVIVYGTIAAPVLGDEFHYFDSTPPQTFVLEFPDYHLVLGNSGGQGSCLSVRNMTVNESFDVSFEWAERPLRPSDR